MLIAVRQLESAFYQWYEGQSMSGLQGSTSKGHHQNLADQPNFSTLLKRAHSLLAQDQPRDFADSQDQGNFIQYRYAPTNFNKPSKFYPWISKTLQKFA